jgi:hypothetical protein
MTAPATPLERAQQLAETAAGPLKAVEKATTARQHAEAKLAETDAAWQTAIKAAVEAGAPVLDVAAKAGGIHRSRVWQIVTGKGPRRRTAAAQ